MSKRLLSIASGVLIAILAFSNAFAGNIKLSSVTFSIGSLDANGGLTGLGNTNVILVLDASGPAGVICTNNGLNQVPGQSSPKVFAEGTTKPNTSLTKNGSTPFGVKADVPYGTPLDWQAGGCPNANWTAQITYVYWTNATIIVKDAVSGFVYLQKSYTCITTPSAPAKPTTVTCTPQ